MPAHFVPFSLSLTPHPPSAACSGVHNVTFVSGYPAPNSGNQYYGKLIGSLQEYAHKIRGTAYAVDESTIFIKGFNYDGTGPGKT